VAKIFDTRNYKKDTYMTNFLTKEIDQFHMEPLIMLIKTLEASTDPALWIKLCLEEAQEALDALTNESVEQQLKELSDLRYVIVGLAVTRSPYLEYILSAEAVAMVTSAEALIDKVNAILEERQAESDELSDERLEISFQRVHESNMSKLGDDGKPIRREDGKVLKGPNYKAPDLSDLVEAA
jgi:hypothetical protein